MLYEFITTYRDAIIVRSKEKLTARPWPAASANEVENGVPLFLTQLTTVLQTIEAGGAYAPAELEAGGVRHGRELLELGFSVSQVVHDYGDICQAVTEVAVEHSIPITTAEFHTLNRCLDAAIAEAVTEHERITSQARYAEDSQRSGHIAHETRDLLNTAILAFETLKRGTVAINGSTGAVLGRSLLSLRDLVNSTLSDIRITADQQKRERMAVAPFIDELAVTGHLQAEVRGLTFTSERVELGLFVNADAQLLASAVTNLLNNAFKFSRADGTVVLRARRENDRLLIEVEDECGGIQMNADDLFQPFGDRRGLDRTGLGLGLSIVRKIARAHGGDVHARNLPGHGCVFVLVLPLAPREAPALPTVA